MRRFSCWCDGLGRFPGESHAAIAAVNFNGTHPSVHTDLTPPELSASATLIWPNDITSKEVNSKTLMILEHVDPGTRKNLSTKTLRMLKEETGADETISRHQKWVTYATPNSLQIQQVSQKSSKFQLLEIKGLYWRIWHMDLVQSAVLYSVMTLISTYLVAFAYKNVKFVLKHKVAQKREDAVSKEVTRKLSEADNRKMSRKEKDERILWKKNEVADYEATTFSIFYNNTLFLVLVIIASFFVLKNFNPTVNYILFLSASSGLIALLSTGSK
ncbi:PREDICTED: translocon-associated protein subunit gamma [Nipponia nippon]|uniref:translocon-associated protein subunit gamma n=1 Tax=Nipponia nippon TaxID=128390 RepID=UPI000510DBD0|nr:PREDICTED: translocon-associated protein subunit gamma [Nipponia nippon]